MAQLPFEFSQKGKNLWENEAKASESYREASRAKEIASLKGEHLDGITVEGDELHHDMGGRVPRIVFPEEEETARTKGVMNDADGFMTFIWRNVMKNTVAQAGVDLSRRCVFVKNDCG